MQKLYHTLDILQTLITIPIPDRQSYLQQHKSIELGEILSHSLSNFNTFRPHQHVLKYDKVPTLTYDKFIVALQNQDMNILRLIRRADYKYNDVLLDIIYKRLHLGIHYKVINTILDIDTRRVDMMSATELNVHNIKFPLILDKIIAGVKCCAVVDGDEVRLTLSDGTLLSFPTIESEALRFAKGEDMVFDGILRAEKGIDVQSIISRNKRKHYVQDIDKLLQLVIYDENPLPAFVISNSKKTYTQYTRLLNLQRRHLNFVSRYVNVAEPEVISTLDKLVDMSSNKCIIKQLNAKYVFMHSKKWMYCEQLYLSVLLVTNYDIDNNIAVCDTISIIVTEPDAEVYRHKPPIGKFIEVVHTSEKTNARYVRIRIDIEKGIG